MSDIVDIHGKTMGQPAPQESGHENKEISVKCPYCEADPMKLEVYFTPTPMNRGHTYICVFYCGICLKSLNAIFADQETISMSPIDVPRGHGRSA